MQGSILPIGITSTEMFYTLKRLLPENVPEEVQIEHLGINDLSVTSPEEPSVQVTCKNAYEVTGISPKPFIFARGTDAKWFRWSGMPAFCYGPRDIQLAHVIDERISSDNIVKASEVYACTALDYLGGHWWGNARSQPRIDKLGKNVT